MNFKYPETHEPQDDDQGCEQNPIQNNYQENIQQDTIQQNIIQQNTMNTPYSKAKDQYKNIVVEKQTIEREYEEKPYFDQKLNKKKSNFTLNPFKWIAWIFKQIWKFLKLIKNLLVGILLFLFILLIGFVLIFAYKPPFVWNPMKTFLNNELVLPQAIEQTEDQIYEYINTTAKNQSIVELTEAQFTKIAIAKLEVSKKNFFKFETDNVIFHLNIDTDERPLWAVLSASVKKNEKIKVQKIGFGRMDTPSFFSSLINDTVGSIFSFVEKLVTADNNLLAFNELIDTRKIDKSITLKEVKVEEGKIVLTYQKSNSGPNQY